MGDIAFNIAKFVDFDKVVNLDIDKNVDVTVNNPDILATSEADAEAFGPNALAEVDAFTYVKSGETVTSPGQMDALGNTIEFEQGPDEDGDGYPDTIRIELDGDPTVQQPDGTFLPDVDDINGLEHLAPVNAPPPDNLPDLQLPVEVNTNGFTDGAKYDLTDKVLVQTGNIIAPGIAEYRLDSDFIVNYGQRTLDTLLDPGPYELNLVVPAGTIYEVDFPAFPDISEKELIFNDDPTSVQVEFGPIRTDVLQYTQTAAFIGSIGEWSYDVNVIFHEEIDGGEAFAYAESTAALDLI